MKISLEDFIEDLVGSGLRKGWRYRLCFRPEVLQRWLDDHKWVEDSTLLCAQCQHMNQVTRGEVTEESCRQNVVQGGSCYRETLKTVFMPFVRDALSGKAPRLREFGNIVHKQGPIWQGSSNLTLGGMIDHELIGTLMKMEGEGYNPI